MQRCGVLNFFTLHFAKSPFVWKMRLGEGLLHEILFAGSEFQLFAFAYLNQL